MVHRLPKSVRDDEMRIMHRQLGEGKVVENRLPDEDIENVGIIIEDSA